MRLHHFLLLSLLTRFGWAESTGDLQRIENKAEHSKRLVAHLNQYSLQVSAALRASRRMSDSPFMCQGRLTVQSGNPVPTANLANQSNLYFTPYQGSRLALYDGTKWVIYPFTEVSAALSGMTASTNYDVFIYDNAGTLALALVAWASATARASGITTQDGVYVLSSNTTRRYLGTLRATSATQTQDTEDQRFVWNYYNRVRRPLRLTEATNTWNYNTALYRPVANNAANVIEYVAGDETTVSARGMVLSTGTATDTADVSVSFGLDTTATALPQSPRGGSVRSTIRQQLWGETTDLDNGLGYHQLYWIEYGNGSGVTFYGDAGDTRVQAGVVGWIYG